MLNENKIIIPMFRWGISSYYLCTDASLKGSYKVKLSANKNSVFEAAHVTNSLWSPIPSSVDLNFFYCLH
jgi:hypothetical protein